MKLYKGEVLRLNRESVGRAVREAGVDPSRCVVITHERLARLREELPGTLLHIFGHIHQFSDHNFKGTKYIDVAALDRPISGPLIEERSARDRFGNINAGNYATIEIDSSLEIKTTCIPLQQD